MISSVIAKLDCGPVNAEQTLKAIASHPRLEMGELIDGRMLPVTIEAEGNQETEEITRWMLSLEKIAFVDVVFVHFEDNDTTTSQKRSSISSSKN